MSSTHLQFDGITKVFPGVKALDDVSFSAKAGSIHALMGENGAGKSTLLKILSGAYQPTSGSIRLGDETHVFNTTSAALAAGIAVIYQELHLAPEMTVAENMFLGHLPNKSGLLNRAELNARAAEILASLGEDIAPTAKVGRLPIGQRQMVEIGKALSQGAEIIAFDEPTSSLSTREIEQLFKIIRDLKAQGKVVLYVSHRMEEIFELCDAVTVFRDGRHVETFDAMSEIDHDILVNRMVGRDIADIFNYQARPLGNVALSVSDLQGPGVKGTVDFEVKKSEIVGFFGLIGAGRSEVMRLLFGAERPAGGSVSVLGNKVDITSPAQAIRHGVVLCPEDRKKEGIVPVLSVQDNLNISARRHHSAGGVLINERWERSNAAEFVEKLAIRTPGLRQKVDTLSGGNQQKVILARWLCEDIHVILLDEPTRGIDVGAKAEIYNIIYELTQQGVAVIVVSSDLPEVMGICDRVLVMRDGCIVADVERAESSEETLLKHALPVAGEGQTRDEEMCAL